MGQEAWLATFLTEMVTSHTVSHRKMASEDRYSHASIIIKQHGDGPQIHNAALKLDQQGDFSFAIPPLPQLSTPQIRAGRYINSLRTSSDKGSTETFLHL